MGSDMTMSGYRVSPSQKPVPLHCLPEQAYISNTPTQRPTLSLLIKIFHKYLPSTLHGTEIIADTELALTSSSPGVRLRYV